MVGKGRSVRDVRSVRPTGTVMRVAVDAMVGGEEGGSCGRDGAM
jgi:hypothetical protein